MEESLASVTPDGIIECALKYMRLNERRRQLEYEETELKKVLERHFIETGTREVVTPKGTVRQQEVVSVDYDPAIMKTILPKAVFEMVAKVTINNKEVDEMLKDGRLEPKLAEAARKVAIGNRIVVVPKKKATGMPDKPI